MEDLLTIKQASEWASAHLGKNVTTSNISYLINYGKIRKVGENGGTFIAKNDLINYYNSFFGKRELDWKDKLGEDLNWALSFEHLKEAETTKHVHRLHPYKGKFIPQLVEYFLDDHTDEFKKEVFFKKGDVVLDIFGGSGTTLVQASELGMHALGVDISSFNALISNVKLGRYDFVDLHNEIQRITLALKQFLADKNALQFEAELTERLNKFNNEHFPVPEYKFRLNRKEIDEEAYGREKEKKFLPIYFQLVEKYGIVLKQSKVDTFLDKWYLQHVRDEIDFVFGLVKEIKNIQTKKVISVILSRTIRSCRATTHADLATLKEPVTVPYYCAKHGKVCKPLFSILSWWERYAKDTVQRLAQFQKLRTDTFQYCLTGDTRDIDLVAELEKKLPQFAEIVKNQKIKGIFSSPPYVGLIDYHEQHAYAYDLFGFERNDEKEIGSMKRGVNLQAKLEYAEGIAQALKNAKRFMIEDFDVFLVANDKFNLYPSIAEQAGMKIVNQYKRPVLNRTEKDKGAYSEIIFHLKTK
ncbi:MAG: DNA methyltransferase [Saprospiraceae bacterium]